MWSKLLLLAACIAPASASDVEDAEIARGALERGEVLPLADILVKVETSFDWRMIEVDLEADDGGFFYEFEMIDRDGVIRDVTVDGLTGDVLGVELD